MQTGSKRNPHQNLIRELQEFIDVQTNNIETRRWTIDLELVKVRELEIARNGLVELMRKHNDI